MNPLRTVALLFAVALLLAAALIAGCDLQAPPQARRHAQLAAAAQPAEGASLAGDSDWNALGLQVREVPQAARKALGVAYGVMVVRVRGPASQSRILPGDVIVGVGDRAVHGLEEFNKLVGARGRAAVALLVRRADLDLYVVLFPAGAGSAGGEAEASRGGVAPPPDRLFRRPTNKPLRT